MKLHTTNITRAPRHHVLTYNGVSASDELKQRESGAYASK
jgi:hypothetical protein